MAVRRIDFFKPIKEVLPIGRDYKGEVGVEIEVEGRNLLREIPSYWQINPENSLRGESAEYVLKQPCARGSVRRFVEYLKDRLDKNGAKIEQSIRTSVHVHMNVNNWNFIECFNYITLYLMLEDLLTHIAGPTRVSNLFCLRARDAEYLIDVLTRIANTRRFNANPEDLRYSSINICAMQKFNSLEFRALRGTVNPDEIMEWIDLLLAMKDAAKQFQNPIELMGDLSRLGGQNFVAKIFGANQAKMLTNQKDFESRLWESTRLVQEVAFASDWLPFPEEPKERMFVPGVNNGLQEGGFVRPVDPGARAWNDVRPRVKPVRAQAVPGHPNQFVVNIGGIGERGAAEIRPVDWDQIDRDFLAARGDRPDDNR